MMKFLRQLANGSQQQSFANRMRDQRFAMFEQLCEQHPRPLRIIDVGGTSEFWQMRGWDGRSDVRIVVVNMYQQPQVASNIIPKLGDATDLSQFPSGSFDIAFSNSVIEHLFTFEAQQAMAGEMLRIGNAIWLQTPNYWFPMEPHFLMPGWQWMPRRLRIAILQRARCGWRGPAPRYQDAACLVDEVRLLSKRELQVLFPGAAIMPELFAGLVKSWIVHTGFAARAESPMRLAA